MVASKHSRPLIVYIGARCVVLIYAGCQPRASYWANHNVF